MDKREQRNRQNRLDEIESGLIQALRSSGELAGSGSVTAAERQQLRKLNRQLKFYMQKVGAIKNNGNINGLEVSGAVVEEYAGGGE